MKKTKIVCTIGPACESAAVMKTMLSHGMNCARINLSHGDIHTYKRWIRTIRRISSIPIMFDTKGSEVRVYLDGDLKVNCGDIVTIGFDQSKRPYFDFNFANKVEVGSKVFIDDGLIASKVHAKTKDSVTLKFINSGTIKNAKRLNLPDSRLDMPVLHEKDIECLRLANALEVDFIALSFTRTKDDVLKARQLAPRARIIAKIENHEGVSNLEEILKVANGIMIARGDLGVEMPSEKIPLVQKEIIKKCNIHGKFVIVATQMLQSMIDSTVPTRAETSDVANAILDGADAIMLSGETTIGKYPALAVQEMSKIAAEVENKVNVSISEPKVADIAEAISHSVHTLKSTLHVTKIIVISKTGYTARLISRFRMNKEIITLTPSERVRKELELHFGVLPVVYRIPIKNRILSSALFAYKKGLVSEEDLVLFTAGFYSERTTNLIEVHKICDLLEYAKRNHIS